MLALAFVYQGLSMRKPELDAGPYAYAKAGFGPFIGFNSAWGYWLSAWLGNVSYAVVVFSALSYFFPAFGAGNTWQAIVGASIVLCDPHRAVIVGPSPLYGATISSPDIRAGMALLIAALAAEGKSVIYNVEQIDRGYQQIDARLVRLGASIQRIVDRRKK